MDIYVGNLSPDVRRDDLIEIFDKFGEVKEVRLIKEDSGHRFKGFAFIDMPSDEQAQKAIDETNGLKLKERPLDVSQAKPKKPRSPGGGKKRGGKKRGGNKRAKPRIYGGENRTDLGSMRPGTGRK
ncbi:MAG: RNA-binding protein [Planctomycetes bacterium]|nr:RNA-binding protein [Planctomycetota bacterium]